MGDPGKFATDTLQGRGFMKREQVLAAQKISPTDLLQYGIPVISSGRGCQHGTILTTGLLQCDLTTVEPGVDGIPQNASSLRLD